MRVYRIPATIATAAFLLSVFPANAQFAPSPTPPVTFPTGHAPAFVVVGNLNGDALPDLAVANKVDNTVSILLGIGNGDFAPSGSFVVGTNPSSIVMADFNNDGYQDLAVTNEGDGTVTVLLGNGSGGIKATLGPFPVGANPISIVTAHFNGDPYADLAVVNRGSNNVTVLVNDGTAHFISAPYSPVAVGNDPSSIAVADFNNDGMPDLAIANGLDNTVTVLLANASGGFTPFASSPFPTGANPDFVVSADFNGDGNPDIAIANLTGNTITVLLGDGLGGFSPASGSPVTAGPGPVFIAVADFNGDGFPDMAVANSGKNTVAVMLGSGTGTFKGSAGSPFAVGINPYPSAIGVGDFNSDGKLDLAVTDLGDADVSVLLNGFTITPVMVSAASFSASSPVAPGSIVSVFGNYSVQTAISASSVPLPTCLAATGITMTDFSGVMTPLDLYYAAPSQINAFIPTTAATGAANFAISTYSDPTTCKTPLPGGPQKGTLTLAAVAPALFSANGTGKGVAAAQFATSVLDPVLQFVFNNPCSLPVTPCVPVHLDVSSGSSVLVLYGTGIRNRASISAVTVTINGLALSPFYAGLAPGSIGEDQVNVALPASLAGAGTIYVTVSVAGSVSNQVTLCFTNPGNSPPACLQ